MNIQIEPTKLNETILLLNKDNENIKQTIEKIYNCIFPLLDDSVWKSPEKNILLDELVPFINNIKNSLYTELNNCANFLNDALNSYIKQDEILKRNVGDKLL